MRELQIGLFEFFWTKASTFSEWKLFKNLKLVGFGISGLMVCFILKKVFLRITIFSKDEDKKEKLTDIGFIGFSRIKGIKYFSEDLDKDQCLFEHQSTSKCKYISAPKVVQARFC